MLADNFRSVQCDAVNGNVTVTTWKVRCSFPVYLIAMAATAGVSQVARYSSGLWNRHLCFTVSVVKTLSTKGAARWMGV